MLRGGKGGPSAHAVSCVHIHTLVRTRTGVSGGSGCTGPAGAVWSLHRGCSLGADAGHLQGFLHLGGPASCGPGFRIAKNHLDCFE